MQSSIAHLVKADPGLLSVLKAGDLVEGKFLHKKSKSAYFDLGKYGTGVVYGVEFANASEVLKGLKIGDSINAKIMPGSDKEDYINYITGNFV